MKKFFVRVLACLSVAMLLAACTPAGVLRPPSDDALAPLVLTPARLAQMTKIPTRVRAGDTLRIVRDAQDAASLDLRNMVNDSQTQNYVVRPDGTFSYRYAGRVEAAGKTPEELAEVLKGKLDAYYKEPGVTVNIVASPTSKVVIGGAVNTPLTLDMMSVANLQQALFAAGGMLSSADPGRVALLRLDEQDRYQVHFVDFSQALQPTEQGRESITFQRGDIVFVPKSTAGVVAESIDLYINQMLPFTRSLGINFSKSYSGNTAVSRSTTNGTSTSTSTSTVTSTSTSTSTNENYNVNGPKP
jgi:protein involved in polysaccharide export with SLBB domain